MIDNLNAISTDSARLEDYLSETFQEIYDFFTTEKHSVLLESRNKIHKYILLKIQVLRALDITKNTNLSFLTLLLDISERFGFLDAFQLVYEILKNNNFDFGRRLEAAAHYLVGVNTSDDYLSRFSQIYEKLQLAYETEEDTEAKVLATMINYYGQVLYNFEFFPQAAISLKENILVVKKNDQRSFLQHPLMESILNIPIIPHDQAFDKIHQLLDAYLGRDIIRLFSSDPYLIEEKTQYAFLLSKVEPEFNKVREISNSLYLPIKNDSIFHSLQRGVKILDDENQFFAYIYSYGKMHYAKLTSAFECLPDDLFQRSIRIVDWGCGQGLATVCYLNYIKSRHLSQDVRHITLIEPSEIALKRATLNSHKFTGGNNILTLNKDLDSLKTDDFRNVIPIAKLQLFSNILDIDLFSLTDLIDKIKNSFKGDNYFVCVSPYVNDVKTSRIDSFVNAFSKVKEFELISSINEKSGNWIGNWSRVIRVFRCRL